jgi:hypothetical protein
MRKREQSLKADFIWTQTALKDFESSSTCPIRWYKQWVLNEIDFPSNDSMNRGSYFEYLVIGAGAGEDSATDLPRLKNGKKSTNQIRIEEQAARIHSCLFNKDDPNYFDFEIEDIQVNLRSKDRKGTLDIVGRWGDNPILGEEFKNKQSIVDLKLTRDIYGVLPPYCYGDLDSMDLLQLYHYANLYGDNFKTLPETFLLVADYSPRRNVRFEHIPVTPEDTAETDERFNTAKDVFGQYSVKMEENKKDIWTVNSSYECIDPKCTYCKSK